MSLEHLHPSQCSGLHEVGLPVADIVLGSMQVADEIEPAASDNGVPGVSAATLFYYPNSDISGEQTCSPHPWEL